MKKKKCNGRKRKQITEKKGCIYTASIVSVVIALVVSSLFYARYNAWFGNIPEEPYELADGIDRITLTPGENFTKERVVSWRDNSGKRSKLEYYMTDSFHIESDLTRISVSGEDVVTRAGHAYYFHANLTDLREGCSYTYRIVSESDSTAWRTFSMPAVKDTLRFLYIGDVQDPIGKESDSLFNKLRRESLKYDFIAFTGDQIERPMDKYWNIWYASLGEWTGTVPLVLAPGNHEYLKGFNKHIDSRWIPQYNFPQNGPEDFKGQSYYIDFPLMRIIVLDSNIIQWPRSIFQHYRWLKETLKSATQPWKVVMFHHGVYSVKNGRTRPIMKYVFATVLKRYGADLVLQGHDHAYSRIATKVDADATPPVFIISSASPKFYRNNFDKIHDRLGSGLALYQTIEITEDNLHYKSMQFDGTVYDDLIIKNDSENKKHIVDNACQLKEIFNYSDFADNEKGKSEKDLYLKEVKKRGLL